MLPIDAVIVAWPGETPRASPVASMVATAAGWAHYAGATPTRDAATDLRAWYAGTLADNTRDDDWYQRHLRGWVTIIRTHLEPPERFTLHHACPVCGGTSWGDAINGGALWPIEVRYRMVDNDRGESTMTDEVATCRIPECATRWVGHASVTELADELQERSA